MRRFLAAVAAALLCAVSAAAGEGKRSARKIALDIVGHVLPYERMEESWEGMAKLMAEGMNIPGGSSPGLVAVMSEIFPYSQALNTAAEVYADEFDADELETILNFYSTAVGRRAMEMLPVVSQAVAKRASDVNPQQLIRAMHKHGLLPGLDDDQLAEALARAPKVAPKKGSKAGDEEEEAGEGEEAAAVEAEEEEEPVPTPAPKAKSKAAKGKAKAKAAPVAEDDDDLSDLDAFDEEGKAGKGSGPSKAAGRVSSRAAERESKAEKAAKRGRAAAEKSKAKVKGPAGVKATLLEPEEVAAEEASKTAGKAGKKGRAVPVNEDHEFGEL